MAWMICGPSVFNQVIGGWDASSVTTMESMFSNAHAFNKDICGWDVLSIMISPKYSSFVIDL